MNDLFMSGKNNWNIKKIY